MALRRGKLTKIYERGNEANVKNKKRANALNKIPDAKFARQTPEIKCDPQQLHVQLGF